MIKVQLAIVESIVPVLEVSVVHGTVSESTTKVTVRVENGFLQIDFVEDACLHVVLVVLDWFG